MEPKQRSSKLENSTDCEAGLRFSEALATAYWRVKGISKEDVWTERMAKAKFLV